jgi:hypothetical protein
MYCSVESSTRRASVHRSLRDPHDRVVNVLILIVGCFLASACTTTNVIRESDAICTSPDPDTECPKDSLQYILPVGAKAPTYSLGIIELDDQGQLQRRSQMLSVLDDATRIAGSDDDYISVVFVHGWKHSAAPHDGNIETFRAALLRLSKNEQELSARIGKPPRKIVGAYVGWRGGSISVPYLDNLSFWDRKNTAHKVGHNGVTEILTRLDAIRIAKDALAGGQSRSRLVVVGHSFGGAIVYSALGQILESRFIQPQLDPLRIGDMQGFGNLVVLINPAFEAELFSSLSDMSLERATYFKSQLPVLAVLTSEADDATKIAFPLGRHLSTMFEKEKAIERPNPISKTTEKIDEHDTNVTAIGHYQTYQTHYLKATDTKLDQVTDVTTGGSAASIIDVSQQWENDAPGSVIEFPGSSLTRTQSSAGRNPYLIIKVDKALIRNHNDLSNPRIAEFISHLILVASQTTDAAVRVSERATSSER